MLHSSIPVLCHGRGVSVVVVGSMVADLVYYDVLIMFAMVGCFLGGWLGMNVLFGLPGVGRACHDVFVDAVDVEEGRIAG
jgi:hypothetical protein